MLFVVIRPVEGTAFCFKLLVEITRCLLFNEPIILNSSLRVALFSENRQKSIPEDQIIITLDVMHVFSAMFQC